MESVELKMSPVIPPWDTVINLADALPSGSWMLVGGLMTQAHAMVSGYDSRATHDIDILIDVMASAANVPNTVKQLQPMGFKIQEPGLRGTAEALSDPNDSAWRKLNTENRKAVMMQYNKYWRFL